MDNKIFRSRTDSMIAGVCGGLGSYLRIDVTLVRLFFILLAMAGSGIGVLVYFLLWIILPLDGQKEAATLEDNVRQGSEEIADRARAMGDDLKNMVSHPNPRAGIVIGVGLILLGCVYLIQNLHLRWLTWLDFDVTWPILLIVGGIALLIRHFKAE